MSLENLIKTGFKFFLWGFKVKQIKSNREVFWVFLLTFEKEGKSFFNVKLFVFKCLKFEGGFARGIEEFLW